MITLLPAVSELFFTHYSEINVAISLRLQIKTRKREETEEGNTYYVYTLNPKFCVSDYTYRRREFYFLSNRNNPHGIAQKLKMKIFPSAGGGSQKET